MEQSFSKASRCFHDGRFGPKAEDTERRCMTVLCMTDKDDQKAIVFGARILYASAVKNHRGKQVSPRLDKGIARKAKPTSERTWLQNKKQSLQKVTAALPATEANTEEELSVKGRKEIALQKKRRFDRAIDAAQSGYLLEEDEGTQPFDQAAAKKRKLEQQDAKRIDKMAACNLHWKNVSQHQTWNWMSLGAEKAWSTTLVSQSMCRPLVLLEAWFFSLALEPVLYFITCHASSCQDPREAKVFICGQAISDKVYLLAVACGGCIISKNLIEGKSGFKLQYQERKFAELKAFHRGIHCSESFRLQHQGFMQVLSHVVDKHQWRKLKEESLDKKSSVCLVAKDDKDSARLKKKAKHIFEKNFFVKYVTDTCLSRERSFLVAGCHD